MSAEHRRRGASGSGSPSLPARPPRRDRPPSRPGPRRPAGFRKASEIGAFLYCRRAWWLRHGLGLPPGNAEARARGVAAHDRMGRQLRDAAARRRLAFWLFLAALALLAWGLLAGG